MNLTDVHVELVDRPAVAIILEVERSTPRIILTATTPDDLGRLADWLKAHDELADIFKAARAVGDPDRDLGDDA